MFSCQARGRGLHFRTIVRLPEMAYLMFPRLNPIFEFGNEFDKTPILRHFHPFLPRQKPPHITQKSHQALENKAFPRTQPKITLLIRNFHLTNYQKFNRKISQTPVKSTLLLSNTNQNFILLSKSKNLSYHKSHYDHNQNSHLSPIQIENI